MPNAEFITNLDADTPTVDTEYHIKYVGIEGFGSDSQVRITVVWHDEDNRETDITLVEYDDVALFVNGMMEAVGDNPELPLGLAMIETVELFFHDHLYQLTH